jgi:hypothetical protein
MYRLAYLGGFSHSHGPVKNSCSANYPCQGFYPEIEMTSRTVTIKRFSLGSLALWGFMAAMIVACLPSFLCSWTFFASLAALRTFIGGWGDVGFSILGQKIGFNLIELLKLGGFYEALNAITAWGFMGIVLLAFASAILLGIFGALSILVLGAIYNAIGRLQVEVE